MKKLNKHLTLLGLQIKAAFMALPKIMAGMLVFGVLMVALAYGLVIFSEDNKEDSFRMSVAVVYPGSEESKKENKYIEQAFAMLGQLDAVKDACTFHNYYSEQEALSSMKKGASDAVVVLPEQFITSIITGENAPARIVFPSSGVNTSSVIFREILSAAAADLSTAQAGIYAVDDVIHQYHGSSKDIENAEFTLNLKYIAYALDRDAYYEQVDVSGAKGTTTTQFYVATGMLMLFLMGGITCVQLLKSETKVMAAALKRYGVAPGTNHVFKVCGVTIVFWCVFSVIYTLVALAVARFPVVANVVTAVGYVKETVANADGTKELVIGYQDGGFINVLAGVGALLVLLLAAMAMAGLIFKLSGKTVSGVILLFLLSVVMMFVSGCFLPVSMLPPIVGTVGEFLPTTVMFELCSQIITGTVSIVTVAWTGLYALAFLFVAAFLENRV